MPPTCDWIQPVHAQNGFSESHTVRATATPNSTPRRDIRDQTSADDDENPQHERGGTGAAHARGQPSRSRQGVRAPRADELEVQRVDASQDDERHLERPWRACEHRGRFGTEQYDSGQDDQAKSAQHVGQQLTMQTGGAEPESGKRPSAADRSTSADRPPPQSDQVNAFDDREGVAALCDRGTGPGLLPASCPMRIASDAL